MKLFINVTTEDGELLVREEVVLVVDGPGIGLERGSSFIATEALNEALRIVAARRKDES